ncbi:GNAT family N-acetyltransferase [Novosphingobium album (ex Liu et al. 2023)]|uniref:GNAT family N-acetyltransferase n=1 Tax=Novosphingobium album (ex Liu et al. 2023) TaxID=3031130 RepID=A0ABT5WV05_9SPHN|nr:GNAT family N-acetyltransferase [Novosphingobium album (ex Liu et al. 2023)]MDE8653727.1 GNAT family N-acetyltransferase [Novosphingobium album (ex Liu et al. 2023)]
MTDQFTDRVARLDDLEALHRVMGRSIARLQTGFLTPEQVAASHKVMGLDSQLVRDGTYFLVEYGERIAGCGGWSFRATLYGGDESVIKREPAIVDPASGAAKIRAMYTDPDFTRRGIGRRIIRLCEEAARSAGYRRVELMATAAGVPLYESCGYQPKAKLQFARVDGVAVPLLQMEKVF